MWFGTDRGGAKREVLAGDPIRLEAEGDLADCIQHEVDHLEGILYIDHLSPMERQLVLGRYRNVSARKEA